MTAVIVVPVPHQRNLRRENTYPLDLSENLPTTEWGELFMERHWPYLSLKGDGRSAGRWGCRPVPRRSWRLEKPPGCGCLLGKDALAAGTGAGGAGTVREPRAGNLPTLEPGRKTPFPCDVPLAPSTDEV